VADWSSIVVPELEELDQFALGMTIAEVKALYGLDEVVKLSWNENQFGPLRGVEAAHAEPTTCGCIRSSRISTSGTRSRRDGGERDERCSRSRELALIGHVAARLLRRGDAVVVPTLTYELMHRSRRRGATENQVPTPNSIDLDALSSAARRVDRASSGSAFSNPTGFALGPDE
jgi:histidinol-phosphate/aromatic aminotransferase/cobyric acid decarboxylase-like protein